MSTTNETGKGSRMKYLQLVDHIHALIEKNDLHIGDRIPSLNQLQDQLGMSKETVLKGLNYLLEKGIIESVYRKGYYVKKKQVEHSYRILLLLDKMNTMREQIYQSLLVETKGTAAIDVYFHHHNFNVFRNIITENINNYTHFVIVTFLKDDPSPIINLIPPNKRIIIDYNQLGLSGNYTAIYQDYEYDIYNSLSLLQNNIQKYQRIILIAHPEALHAEHVINGFVRYCEESSINYDIIPDVDETKFKKHTAFITFSRYDSDDVSLIKLAKKHGFTLGEDIGLISYNDTDVKEILEGGITVISTDFRAMGKAAAKAILQKKTLNERNPTQVIIRKSL
ncbi:GntR family transcriptional regulator [Sphingobacterium sp. BIGb0165]|uniref:GntR family transcriptional regulator n=1 Tax=Sphingobacterium sp. BIGb0165 TaxID=2940615 RepID=UPI002169E94E|nr:GntR family transcriptional regulator [Sphingobacterium sp. BIGb0165]MCS4227575.1 DNA-binding GntR family transcriptional regulator [Sphingobacterium sp. BIGb0165]